MPTFTNKVVGKLNAIEGESDEGRGVTGKSVKDYGMRAHSTESAGLRGSSEKGRGVEGWAIDSEGVHGLSKTGTGVWGQAEGKGTGVIGTSVPGVGVAGRSEKAAGVRGDSTEGAGVSGFGTTGGYFEGSFEGIHVVGHHAHAAGVAGYNDSTGPGIFGKSTGGPAGYFDGDVIVVGDIRLPNADCAEDFDVHGADTVEPGTVMVVGDEGALRESTASYDKRAAGVISGAGEYKAGIVLDSRPSSGHRRPLALMGKTYCKVDAQTDPIEVGDLLTTSATPGHAMKASDPARAFGAVIGKALQPLREGTGLIPILIALQ